MTDGGRSEVQGQVYGLLRLGGVDVALPLSALREVVPRPAELAPLPVSATGLVGTMSLRSLVLPVVDLGPQLGRTQAEQAAQVVVVVAHAGRVVGLVADEVRGVARVRDAEMQALSATGDRLLVSHAFQHGADAGPVSVLDAEVLLSLPGVPTVAEPGTTTGEAVAETGVAVSEAVRSSGLTLVRCGAQTLAVEVDDIHTTIPLTAVSTSVLVGGDCLGVTQYAGAEVPVVDPLRLLGLAPLGPSELGAGVVLDLGRGLVVLAVSDLVELRGTGTDGILPVPDYAAGRPELLRGMVELDQGACLVLDGAALREDAGLLALSSVNVAVAEVEVAATPSPSDDGSGGSRSSARGQAYVHFTAGAELATPLSQVSEVLPMPVDLTPAAGDLVLGLFVHRGRVVPVMSLPHLLGHPPRPSSSSACLLLVETGAEQIAFAVDALRGIEPLTWSDPDRDERPPLHDLTRAVRDARLVQLGGTDRFVPDLDLGAVAEAVRATTAARPGRGRPFLATTGKTMVAS